MHGDAFYNFVQTNLLPHLMPFNGTNPHSVVILDNCSIHHIGGIVEIIEEVGALVLYLPPYTPQTIILSRRHFQMSNRLRAMDMEADVMDTGSLVLAAFSYITAYDYQQWIDHASIYL